VLNLIGKVNAQQRAAARPNTVEELKKHKLASDLSRQISRRWKAGDVYAPHDLSPVEMQKWKRRGQPEYDVFDVLDFDPIPEYKVCYISLEMKSRQGGKGD
jgi:small subunit ribosomal protein S18